MKEGAVAARVHVGGEVWTVLKPWQHHTLYRASRTANWRDLAANTCENEFKLYLAALQQHLVEILPIQMLPGAKDPIEWHQILAWCSRDQNARYQNYCQWRADGTKFGLPAKMAATLMQIALGLLHDAETLGELASTAKAIEKQQSKLQALHEKSSFLLEHVRRQLSRCLDTSETIPFRQDGLFTHPNLIDIARQRHDAYGQELQAVTSEQQELANERQNTLIKYAPMKNVIDSLANAIAQKEAIIAGNIERLKVLQNEPESLQKKLLMHCDHGNLLLKDCTHVMGRIKNPQIDTNQEIKSARDSKATCEKELPPLRQRLIELKSEMAPINMKLEEIEQKSTDLNIRYAQSLSALKLLSQAIDDYEYHENVAAEKSPSPDIVEAKRKLGFCKSRHVQLQNQLEKERGVVKERRQNINDIMQEIAKSLPSFQWGVFNDETAHCSHPFKMGPIHSTTFKVLEILAGDIACLLDSTGGQSFHPGFLLHDSPREAEMSAAMLWALLGHVVSSESKAIQYIVTTSTEPPEEFQPFVRLVLSSESEDSLLFRRRLDAGQMMLT